MKQSSKKIWLKWNLNQRPHLHGGIVNKLAHCRPIYDTFYCRPINVDQLLILLCFYILQNKLYHSCPKTGSLCWNWKTMSTCFLQMLSAGKIYCLLRGPLPSQIWPIFNRCFVSLWLRVMSVKVYIFGKE